MGQHRSWRPKHGIEDPALIAKLLLLQRQTLASQPTQFVLIHPQERPGYFTEFHMSELLMRPAYSERIKRLTAIQR